MLRFIRRLEIIFEFFSQGLHHHYLIIQIDYIRDLFSGILEMFSIVCCNFFDSELRSLDEFSDEEVNSI
jgi:hypothetical protein